ncbi:class I SAM-dependent methyltransferase [Saccharothrix violaceirubra]|uniref:SAM-dependent methyltransferase n=1 Tax=Saccharothrix violaceirubra TaxID=413306 RepID=A0A7W7T4Y6_9PSEU|nr:class I SAM-dependent methyltransferase [Saccharothrix violaceirubra]MBB4966669.1 SAM-dependent methyltransferase [Saccharothrix violaceirubra]
MTEQFDAAFWDERYRSRDAIWSGRANPQLVADVAALPPGTALDVGCGEGGDALWLAEHGWEVTAVDFAPTALARAEARADSLGLGGRITWTRADVTALPADLGPFDLVSAQFMHLPGAERTTLVRALAGLVAPGGTLLFVGHHPLDLENPEIGRPDRADLMFTAEQVAAGLDDGWRIVAETRARVVDGLTVHDAVLNARRHSPSVRAR